MRTAIQFMITFLLLTSVSACKEQDKTTPEEVQTIAEEAYIYAYPMLEHYKTMYVSFIAEEHPAYMGPFNTLVNNSELQSPENKAVVRPNSDTFYSGAGLDLRREPMVISVPEITDNRYYSFQLIDLYTHNFDYIGTRTTGFDAGNYLIAGPEWEGEKPEGIDQVLQSEGDFVVALGRTQVYNEKDADQARAIMTTFKIQPLSEFSGQPAPEAPKAIEFPPYSPEKATSAAFITYLNFILGHVQPHPSEKQLLEKFARIGIGPNQPFDASTLAPETKSAIETGIATALEKIEKETGKLGEEKNGWMLISGAFGNRQEMQGRYLTRAAAAMFGLWGNNLDEAFYPATETDEEGDPLDGSSHKYVLHFEKDQLPPVKAFWSLTMYKLPEQLLIENEIDRYKIGSASEGLKYNDDGSLDIYIQNERPGKEYESNWLPAYDGKFSLQARMYWPDKEALDPLYVPPAVIKND